MLLGKVQGDRKVAERPLKFERERVPYANREELLQQAIDRWEGDNRSFLSTWEIEVIGNFAVDLLQDLKHRQ